MNHKDISKFDDVMDRFQEAHYWIHMLEKHYYDPDIFRWHLNSFLKALNEVQQLIPLKMQTFEGFKDWYIEKKKRLKSEKLLSDLALTRNFVVHQGALRLENKGSIGITKGRGMKLGITVPIDPRESSDEAMYRFVWQLAVTGDFFGFLANDEDTRPCVERVWSFPTLDGEVIEVCSKAWIALGDTIADTIEFIGLERPELTLSCRHSAQRVQFKVYERNPLRSEFRRLRVTDGFERAPRGDDFYPDWADRGEKDWGE